MDRGRAKPEGLAYLKAFKARLCNGFSFEVAVTPEAMLEVALAEARAGLAEGGIPIGAAVFGADGRLVGSGHNRRVQEGDPSAHGETDAFRRAGRERSYRKMTMKYRDGLEQDKADEAALEGKKYAFILDKPYRWDTWAAPRGNTDNASVSLRKLLLESCSLHTVLD